MRRGLILMLILGLLALALPAGAWAGWQRVLMTFLAR